MTSTLTPSKAARFADEAEAMGWEVERIKLAEGGRMVRATRGDEIYELAWHRNSAGTLVYAYGSYSAPSSPAVEIHNVKAALRDMAKYRAANGSLLPFDPENDDAGTILAAVAGKHIRWTNSISGEIEDGDLPRGGMHLRITETPNGRVLNFADQLHTGFRAVRLSQIKEVK